MPEISTVGIFQVAFIARQMEQTPRDFFRRPLNPSVGCVPQGTHAVGWDCRKNGERVRAYRTHPTFGLQLAVFLAEPLAPTATRPLSRGRELERGQQAARLVFGRLGSLGKIAAIRENALSPTLPRGGGSGLQRIQALQVV